MQIWRICINCVFFVFAMNVLYCNGCKPTLGTFYFATKLLKKSCITTITETKNLS